MGARIEHLHYSDTDGVTSELHYPPGKGLLDLAAMNQALVDIGFAGTSTLDMYGYPVPEQGYIWGLPFYRAALIEIGLAVERRSMKAALLRHFGEGLAIADVPVPQPGSSEALVKGEGLWH